MSLGDRFINLLRSNINAVFERGHDGGTVRIEELSDDEIEAEMIRRRARREAAERAADGGSYSEDDWAEVEEALRGSKRYRRTGRRTTGSYQRAGAGYGTGAARRAAAAGRDPRLAQLYAQLECTYGSDLTAVRKAYRAMMRKYHPDMHSGSPEKQRVATDLSQRLTSAYNELKRLLSSPGAS